ncbi:hypothetical protein BSKO_05261 [Bryopsis sp. KO-2023]|nr:hypothetical protein BSKO_05261 [Bryopsis sp. KO-2023]
MIFVESARERNRMMSVERVAMLAIGLTILAGTTAGARDSTYGTISHTLTLPPDECVDLEFLVPRGQYLATLDVSGFPPECAATETLSMTDQFYSDSSCLYYDQSSTSAGNRDGCVTATSVDDICRNWGHTGAPFEGNFTLAEHHCSDVIYFAGFKSSCPVEVRLRLLIKMSDLTEETREFCKAIGDAKKGLNELFYLVVGMMIGLPMMLVALGAACCCCFLCPSCPGHKLVSKDPAVVPMGYHLISHKSSAASAPAVIVVPSSDAPESPEAT